MIAQGALVEVLPQVRVPKPPTRKGSLSPMPRRRSPRRNGASSLTVSSRDGARPARARIPDDGSAPDKVRAFTVAAATVFAEHRSAWIAASTAFWTDPDRHRMVRRVVRRRQIEQRLRDLIREGIDSGEFRAVDPATAGRLILSGITWMHRCYDPSKSLSAEDIVGQYADIILGGLQKH